jgi:Fic-DOC domain mobile mystery protein B
MNPPLPPGATPLDPDEAAELIPRIATSGELDEFEAANIETAVRWALGRGGRAAARGITTPDGLLDLHRRMFDRTWKWAGRIRNTNKSIGVPKEYIRPELKNLCDDVNYQIEHDTYPADMLAVRFHHRLVSIHVFPNGNGRHSRLAADLLVGRLGQPPFSWGGIPLRNSTPNRGEYIASLRDADGGSIERLLAFARS